MVAGVKSAIGGAVEAIAGASRGVAAVKGRRVWLQSHEWLERIKKFKADHCGKSWFVSDGEIKMRAHGVAAGVGELLDGWAGGLNEAERLDAVIEACRAVGVDEPVSITAEGAIKRALSETWWRRVLRREAARRCELAVIEGGGVHARAGGYASNRAVRLRIEQEERNAAILRNTAIKNEAGQYLTLARVAESSVSNRDVRRGELMTRIRGCEEWADEKGHAGLFLTLTCPSRFHAMTIQKGGARQLKNSRYDGSSPRDAQAWLRAAWARARAQLARAGVALYGFRVAEPHHDGCPHWHALLWAQDEAQAKRAGEIIRAQWLKDAGDEPGARRYRVKIVQMERGGAAGYIAKYVAKNVGGSIELDHEDQAAGEQLDTVAVDAGAVQGWQRVNAWAALWGIRQFQAIGQPPVSVWREMRRVTQDQVDELRVQGEPLPWRVWGAVHRVGTLKADWRRFVQHMGGMCRARAEWAIKTAHRVTDAVSQYGEAFSKKVTVGLELRCGRWLVSRRQRWVRADAPVELDEGATAAALARPWTRFNNCTARLTRTTLNAFKGLDAKGVPLWVG